METRIKYIKTTNNGWLYAVQVKKWLFWKTIESYASFEGAERFLNTLKEIDDFNSKKPKSVNTVNKAVYTGYGVRDIISNGMADWRLSFFTTYPKKKKRCSTGGLDWVDSQGHALPLININLPKLFGKEGLEPMKLRITIEQIEE